MFEWTEERVSFMADACERTDFHEKLAALLSPYLQKTDSICDAGCGLGYLSLALSPLVGHVTAAERDDRALDVLRRQLARRHICNVTPLCTDVLAYTPSEPFDAMVFCFFGGMEEIVAAARRQCRGTVLAIVRDDTCHRFSGAPREPGRHSFESACGYLERQGIPYTSRRMALDFPQPLRTREDARRFMALYGRGDAAEALPTSLVSTGDPEFPWQLPGVRRFGMIIPSIDKGKHA